LSRFNPIGAIFVKTGEISFSRFNENGSKLIRAVLKKAVLIRAVLIKTALIAAV
jgi:hypothetical protein